MSARFVQLAGPVTRKCLLVAICLAAAVPFAVARPFTFSAIPGSDPNELTRRFQPVADYLSGQLGLPVLYLPTASYGESLAAFKEGRTDLAWLGGFSGVRGRAAVPGARPIVQARGDTRFTSCFVAHISSDLKPAMEFPYEIEGLSFLFGPKPSTSGHLMPAYFIRERLYLGADEVFSKLGFAGNHRDTLARVGRGEYMAGSVACPVWFEEVQAKRIDRDVLFLLWVSPGYHDYNFTVRGDLDDVRGARFTARLERALLGMTAPELLAAFGRKAWVTTEEANFDIIRKAARAAGLGDY